MLVSLNLPHSRDGLLTLHSADRCPLVNVHFHRHAELELNVVLAGSARYLLDGRRYDVRAGDAVWLHPGQEHCLAEQDEHFRMWVVVFRPELTTRMSIQLQDPTLAEDDPPGHLVRPVGLRWANDFHRMAQTIGGSDSDQTANLGLAWLMSHARTAFQTAPETAPLHLPPAIIATLSILQSEDDPGSLSAIAKRVGLSTTHLSRSFRAETGVAMSVFRNRLRVLRFIEAFGDGSTTTLTEAAFAAGFRSYAQFYSVLRSMIGLTPRAYARKRAAGWIIDELAGLIEGR